MPRRAWPLVVTCTYQGCTASARYEFATLRELDRSHEMKNRASYRCSRHSDPESVLSADNLHRSITLTNEQRPYGRFFGPSGFVHGPGFKAYAEDFPIGTEITITATVKLPKEEPDV